MEWIGSLFSRLSDGCPVSIDAMSVSLGVDRKTLLMGVEKVNADHTFISCAENCLSLCRVTEPIDGEKIWAHAVDLKSDYVIDVVDETGSTNQDLMACTPTVNVIKKRVLVAEKQNAGRGTKGRSWMSIPGGSITFSIAYTLSRETTSLNISPLSLVAGLAVIHALMDLGSRNITLKWPNDLMCQDSKIGGILVEANRKSDRLGIVIGIGLNVRLPQSLMDILDQPVTDLQSSGMSLDRNLIIAKILIKLDEMVSSFLADGFSRFRVEYDAVHRFQDCLVHLRAPDNELISGKVVGVSNSGELILDVAGTKRSFLSGEVQMQRVESS